MKDQILNIAVKQMKDGGYHNLNFANIASELKTTRANLHHHFKNKEGLALAATESYIQEHTAIVDEIIRTNEGDIKAILEKYENYYIEVLSESCNACICDQLIHQSDIPDRLRQLAINTFQEEEKAIEAQVEKSKKNGTLTGSRNVKEITFRIMATILGIGQMSLIESNKTKLINNIRGALVSIIE